MHAFSSYVKLSKLLERYFFIFNSVNYLKVFFEKYIDFWYCACMCTTWSTYAVCACFRRLLRANHWNNACPWELKLFEMTLFVHRWWSKKQSNLIIRHIKVYIVETAVWDFFLSFLCVLGAAPWVSLSSQHLWWCTPVPRRVAQWFCLSTVMAW